MHHDPTEAKFRDFSHLHEHFQDVIDNRSQDMQNTEMTVTGLTKVLEDISDAIYEDLLKILNFWLRNSIDNRVQIAPLSATLTASHNRYSDAVLR